MSRDQGSRGRHRKAPPNIVLAMAGTRRLRSTLPVADRHGGRWMPSPIARHAVVRRKGLHRMQAAHRPDFLARSAAGAPAARRNVSRVERFSPRRPAESLRDLRAALLVL